MGRKHLLMNVPLTGTSREGGLHKKKENKTARSLSTRDSTRYSSSDWTFEAVQPNFIRELRHVPLESSLLVVTHDGERYHQGSIHGLKSP